MPVLNPDDFDAILFDLNDTFMFGQDRFGPEERYGATYRALGGEKLSDDEVRTIVDALVQDLLDKYHDSAWHDRYPGVPETLRTRAETRHLPPSETALVTDVIACHELGDIDADHVAALERFARSHRIGIVSNIWSPKCRWLDRLAERGLLELFTTIVFSSDGPHMKPSPVLFNQARDDLDLPADRILFVGDDPVFDIEAAGAVGMRTVLVGSAESASVTPDWRFRNVPDLAASHW
jgi:FMN phosphatase YigB (HAD superfamily)